jgi:hypothetical protein
MAAPTSAVGRAGASFTPSPRACPGAAARGRPARHQSAPDVSLGPCEDELSLALTPWVPTGMLMRAQSAHPYPAPRVTVRMGTAGQYCRRKSACLWAGLTGLVGCYWWAAQDMVRSGAIIGLPVNTLTVTFSVTCGWRVTLRVSVCAERADRSGVNTGSPRLMLACHVVYARPGTQATGRALAEGWGGWMSCASGRRRCSPYATSPHGAVHVCSQPHRQESERQRHALLT